ncbi:hypothetical protein FRC03_012666 [Tulasnella sp. 419]|nr:hypothetical protein FRC03_012666 [Tulasnella sp. 419]
MYQEIIINIPYILLILLAFLCGNTQAQPPKLHFRDCSSDNGQYVPGRINVSTVYGQIADYGDNPMLKYTVYGQTSSKLEGATPDLLATLFETTSVLSFSVDATSSALCSSLRAPTSAVPVPDDYNCTIPAGEVAFSSSIPYRHDFRLTTINTRLRAVDTSSPAKELVCVDVAVTPVKASGMGGYYGEAQIIFWISVGLAAAYWIVIGFARIAAAWGRGGVGRRKGWAKVKWAGTVLSSAISGEGLSTAPALLRFATPSMRDIIFHTQWCATLAMVAVQWPGFTYPILRNTAWATLVYNVTLIQGTNANMEHWDPVAVRSYEPPAAFADQLTNRSNPIYLDPSVQNTFLLLPDGTPNGIASFAYSIGIRPQDLFGTCLSIYLSIVAATIVLSLAIWMFDWLISSATENGPPVIWRNKHRSPRYSTAAEMAINKEGSESLRADDAIMSGSLPPPPSTRFALNYTRKSWWNYRLGQSSFHGSVLYGNLVRILLLFHVPITLYSCYQFSLGTKGASTTSLALAALSFIFLSLGLPSLLLFRLATSSTGRLYEATRTLLALGPLYNHYAPGQQHFAFVAFAHSLAIAIVVGAGQKSGTAQAIILLIVEVLAALATSMWLPWGEGAHMGAISFIFCVARIVTCVMLVILSPVVSVGEAAGGWIAYTIMLINGLIYLAFLLMLIVKIIEGIVRLVGGISFDRSKHSIDSGLVGVIGLLGCCGGRRRRRSRHHRYRPHAQRESGTPTSTQILNQLPNPMGSYGQSAPVPSYLRPEQALTPYKEDNDDAESGYILGAFHDDYVPPDPAPPSPPATNTGFTRVKGGRAHFETPFAMLSESTPQHHQQQTSYSSMHARNPSSSTLDLPHSTYPPTQYQASNAYPPSSYPAHMSTSPTRQQHARRKSESAVIEDSGGLMTPRAAAITMQGRSTPIQGTEGPLPPPQIPRRSNDDSDESAPRRKFWFGGTRSSESHNDDDGNDDEDSDRQEGMLSRWRFRRGRNKSEADATAAAKAKERTENQQKSFVVVRGPRKEMGSASSQGQLGPSGWRSRPSTAPDHGERDRAPSHSPSPPSVSPQSTWSPRRQSVPFS